MTINKAQGQTFNRVGIHLAIERPCFFHTDNYMLHFKEQEDSKM